MDPIEGTEVDATQEVAGVEPVASEDVVETPGPLESSGGNSQQAPGFNPAWTGLRDAIGEDHFETYARPILQDMDQSAQRRITDLNAKLKGYEGFQSFIDQKVAPEQISQAMQVANMLENEPEKLYEFLSEHLGKGAAAEEQVEPPASDQFSMDDMPPELRLQLEQAAAFQQQMQQQQEQEEYQRQVAAADAELEREMTDFISKNPTWSKDDVQELEEIRFHLTQQLHQQGHRRIASLDEAAKVLQDRIARYAQRGQAAPNTLPTSAGGDIQPQQFDSAKASKNDFINQIANDLVGLRGN